ncbi:MAG: methylated-DNA--[protein]-cysteine S-methyltransferase, partial [Oscillospiraceae bacterium]
MNNSYIMKSPVGLLKICEENDQITGLFKVNGFEESSSNCKNIHHSDLLFEAYNQINQYFSGKRKVFDLPIHYNGTSFQQRVWQELQSIPYGETRSYKDIAISIGNPDAFRAVGQA